jgi:hypothetical protein
VKQRILLLATCFAGALLVGLSPSVGSASDLIVRNDSRHHIIVHVQNESQWRDDDEREWHNHHWRELGSVHGRSRETFHLEHGRYRIAARDEHGHHWPPKVIVIRRGETFTYRFYVD